MPFIKRTMSFIARLIGTAAKPAPVRCTVERALRTLQLRISPAVDGETTSRRRRPARAATMSTARRKVTDPEVLEPFLPAVERIARGFGIDIANGCDGASFWPGQTLPGPVSAIAVSPPST